MSCRPRQSSLNLKVYAEQLAHAQKLASRRLRVGLEALASTTGVEGASFSAGRNKNSGMQRMF